MNVIFYGCSNYRFYRFLTEKLPIDFRFVTDSLPMNILQYEEQIANAQEISPYGRDDDHDGA